jgi:Phage gp6-like head-tail connector protein
MSSNPNQGPAITGPWPTPAEVKRWLRVADSGEDDLLGELTAVAIQAVQERCGQWWQEPPIDVAQAATMHAGRLYKRRDSLDGTIGLPDIGMLQVGRFDADIDGLMYPYRVVRLA